MNTNALRQKILDLAIHGKLVKQDPADESAAILLEEIRAEKEKKIASGELKRGKNDSYIFLGDDNRHYEKFADGRVKDIEDEIPFALPEGWAWCRLGEISSELGDGIHGTPEYTQNGSCYFINGTNLLNGKIIIKQETKTVDEEQYEKYKKDLSSNTMFISINGTLGNIAFYNNEHIILGKSVCYFNLVNEKFKYFFYFLFNGHYFQKYVEVSATGSTIKNVSLKAMNRFLIPLPPLAEQQRIVDTIEAIFAQIDLLEQNKADLQTAIKQAKSKILDLAICGKLVPQDPADEPASVMLEKLRAEKEAKIAAGEIKRGKNDSYIYKNSTDNCYYEKFKRTEEQIEIPFDLPEGWCWQKISSICEINPKNKLDNTLEVSFVPMTLIDSEFNNNFTYELQRWETVKSGFSHFADNDIGIAKITPCFENRKSVIFKNLKNKYGAGTTELHILRTNNEYIFNEYVFWFMKTDTFIKEGINNFTGAVGQQRIGKEFIAETLIPIPPLNEQIKICRIINKLMKKLDKISLNIV